MTYQQAIDYLYNSLPVFSKSGAKAYKADLKNTIALCNFLGNPERKIRTVHVAGTNGKGSTSHMLAAIMQQNGYKTGLYTSPHLQDFRERVKINGTMVPESFVVDFVEKIIDFSEEIEPSFFEITFAMALDYFAQQKVQIAIIETGLGGRLDSTNIISPMLSIITNISYDHMDILGDTLAKIAFEKAGIIKSNTPVIIGEYNEETKPVFIEKAHAKNAPLYFASEEYSVTYCKYDVQRLEITVKHNGTRDEENYFLDLTGLYQQKNLLGVLLAVEILKRDFRLDDEYVHIALAKAKTLTGFHGRWEVIHENPLVVLDVAHNEDGIRQLLAQLSINKHENLHLVFGMVKDKDISKVLGLLPKTANYYFTNAAIPRALPADELQKRAEAYQLEGPVFSDVNKALKSALEQASINDLIIVCGSIFVVAEVKPIEQ